MQQKEIEEKVINLLSDYSSVENGSRISPSSRLEEDLGLDSLDRVETIMRLEEEFNVNFEDDGPYKTIQELVTRIGDLLDPSIAGSKKPKKEISLQDLRVDKTDLEKAGFNPYYKKVESGLGRKIIIDGKELINLGSNDYLGIANSEELKKASHEALEKYGISMCGTPIVIGQSSVNQDLERRLSEFLGTEEALVFPSGYQANSGVFQILAQEGDVIIADKYAHSSLHSGMALTRAKKRLFAHNDTEDLENLLKKSQDANKRFVVVEGLYSTEGDITPLDEVLELSRKYKAFVVLDDAHGIGVLGNKGRGLIEHFDSLGEVDLITGSLGKAIGCFGGFVATSSEVADIFRYKMGSLIYSTALPPAISAASLRAIDMVEEGHNKREQIMRNKNKLFDALSKQGYTLTPSLTPLFSVIAGTNYEAARLSRSLYENGVYGTPFLIPSVPEGRALIRLIPHANLTEEDLNKTTQVFERMKNEK